MLFLSSKRLSLIFLTFYFSSINEIIIELFNNKISYKYFFYTIFAFMSFLIYRNFIESNRNESKDFFSSFLPIALIYFIVPIFDKGFSLWTLLAMSIILIFSFILRKDIDKDYNSICLGLFITALFYLFSFKYSTISYLYIFYLIYFISYLIFILSLYKKCKIKFIDFLIVFILSFCFYKFNLVF